MEGLSTPKNDKVLMELYGDRIAVIFRYDAQLVALIKEIPGRSFRGKDKSSLGVPYWTIPRNLETCRLMREFFGNRLILGRNLVEWARERVTEEKVLGELSGAEDAELENLPHVSGCDELVDNLRSYQRVGASFIASARGTLLADQPGLGKTWEIIAGLLESFPNGGKFLVLAPRTSLSTVWGDELRRLQPYPVFVATETGTKNATRKKRENVLHEFLAHEGSAWLVANPAMASNVRVWEECELHENAYAKEKKVCEKESAGCQNVEIPSYLELHQITWDAVVLDECHKEAVRKKDTLHRRGIEKLPLSPAGKRIASSGTPMRNKLDDLWGILNWLDKKAFSSSWRFMEEFSEKIPNSWARSGYEFTGRLREDAKEALFRSLKPHVLRRIKSEVLKELPEKQRIDRWCEMTTKQAKQYWDWENEAEVAFDNGRSVAGLGVLDMLTRSRQFAVAMQTMDEKGILHPDMRESGKTEHILDILEERGIMDETLSGEDVQKVIIFSQWAEVIFATQKIFEEEGISAAVLTGKTPQHERDRLVREFQTDDGPRVFLMTTTAGGTAITLDRADTVIFIDETWLPDDQEQGEDRAHRLSRTKRTGNPLTVYYLRSSGTVEEEIREDVAEKAGLHFVVLDGRRGLVPAQEAA